jgi:hypothetical protein
MEALAELVPGGRPPHRRLHDVGHDHVVLRPAGLELDHHLQDILFLLLPLLFFLVPLKQVIVQLGDVFEILFVEDVFVQVQEFSLGLKRDIRLVRQFIVEEF